VRTVLIVVGLRRSINDGNDGDVSRKDSTTTQSAFTSISPTLQKCPADPITHTASVAPGDMKCRNYQGSFGFALESPLLQIFA
jgi:hypothetical protein